MPVELAELVTATKNSLNVPGEDGYFDFSDESKWIDALENGFWWARMRGFFKEYRADSDAGTIVNVVHSDVDLPRELQQVIVLFTSMLAIEAKLLSIDTHKADSAKPGLSTERDKSAQLLRDLLSARRADLLEIKELIVGGVVATDVAVIDLFMAREDRLLAGTGTYVLG